LQTAIQMALGVSQDRMPATSVFALPMLASSRTQWRSSSMGKDWLTRLSTEDPDTF
jgi:hypothetical protein